MYRFCSFPFVKCHQNSLIFVCITSIRSNNQKQISKYLLLIDGQLRARIFHHPSAARSIGHHIPAAVAAKNRVNHHELIKYTTTSCVGHQNWYPNNTHTLRVCSNCRQKCRLSNTHEGMIIDTSSSSSSSSGPVNQHPPQHHPLDACYYSVVDEPQLS